MRTADEWNQYSSQDVTLEFCVLLFLVFRASWSIIAATHHTNTLGSSLVIVMLVRIGTIPQAYNSIHFASSHSSTCTFSILCLHVWPLIL
jgi:hypothetical protein